MQGKSEVSVGKGRRAKAERPKAERPKPLYAQLKARPGGAGEAVRRNQRERLLAAMTEAVAGRGYAATTVRELSALAGVSKRTLYEHFDSKEDYFLATYDHAVEGGMQRISAAFAEAAEGKRDSTSALCRAFAAFGTELVQRPAPSRLALIDVLGTGSLALERIERSEAHFMRMIAAAVEPLTLPDDLLRGVVGGVWCVARLRLIQGMPAAVSKYHRELSDWLLDYCSPAATSLAELRRDAPGAALGAPPVVPQGTRQRALHAAARVAGRRGYAELNVALITEDAGISPEEFFTLFDDADACLLASLDLYGARALARAVRAGEGAPDWPAAVCRAVHGLLCHIAVDPLPARAAFVECFAIGVAGIERQAQLTGSFAEVLARRAPRPCRPDPLVAEAIVGAVWSIARHRVARGRASELPSLSGYAAYLVLAPLIGADAALESISAELARERGAYAR